MEQKKADLLNWEDRCGTGGAMGTGKAEQRKTSRATITTGSKMVLDSSGSCVVRRLLVTAARVPRPQWPGCLLASAGFLCRSRVEKKLPHLARRIAGDGTLARPRQCLVHISGFQYPETAGCAPWSLCMAHR